MRVCTGCGIEKPHDAFNKCKSKRDGLQSRCKACEAAYYAANREARNAQRAKHRATLAGREGSRRACAKHYANNREARNAGSAEYHANNREAIKAQKARWRANNRDAIAVRMAGYVATPSGKAAMQRASAKRRAAKANARHEPYDRAELLDLHGHTCAMCGKTGLDDSLPRTDPNRAQIDHIIPISQGGADAPHNLMLLCAPCNMSKTDAPCYEFFYPKSVRVP